MPCGPICPASDALCIAGFKTGWRLWPPTRASFPRMGQATHKKTHWKGNQNQPYLIQLGKGCPPFPALLLSFLLPRFLSPPNPIRYSWLTRGNRASDLQAPSLNCLVVHPLDPPQNPKSRIQNPKSGIQNPKFP